MTKALLSIVRIVFSAALITGASLSGAFAAVLLMEGQVRWGVVFGVNAALLAVMVLWSMPILMGWAEGDR